MFHHVSRRLSFVFAIVFCAIFVHSAAADNIFVGNYHLDQSNGSVSEYTSSGTLLRTFDTGGRFSPYGMTFGPEGNLYVSNRKDTGIARFNPDTGAYLGTVGSVDMENLNVAFGPDGNLYASGSGNVYRINIVTNTTTLLFNPGYRTVGFAFRPDNGDLLMGDLNGGTIQEFNLSTNALVGTFATGYNAVAGKVFGPDGRLYAISQADNTIKVVGATGGTASTFSVGGTLSGAEYLSFDQENNVLVSSYNNNTIQKFDGKTGVFTASFFASSPVGIAVLAVPETSTLMIGSLVCVLFGIKLTFATAAKKHNASAHHLSVKN